MNPYSNLTDDQLAEWHMRDAKVDRLTRELADARQQILNVTAELDHARAAHQSERDDWRADYERVSAERMYFADAHAAAVSQLRRLAEAAIPFFCEWLEAYEPFADEALAKRSREQRQVARAMMSLIEQWLP